jgi:adenosylcobinamide kinase/adenosylcobinamide-phosphate guanylyltransferase
VPNTILVIGGSRSGKSDHALLLGEQLTAANRIFIATCQPQDEEMQRRVAQHRRTRDPSWQTLEEPLDLAGALGRCPPSAGVILVDCLTLWISNLLLTHADDAAWQAAVDALGRSLARVACPVILVSNEVGTGIVPDNPLARRFRDANGWTNQQIAARAGQVIWMVAGIAMTIKALD